MQLAEEPDFPGDLVASRQTRGCIAKNSFESVLYIMISIIPLEYRFLESYITHFAGHGKVFAVLLR